LTRRAREQASGGKFAPRLVVMVKEPVAGRVKTRLARDIGVGGALRFYRHAAATLLARAGADRRWRMLLAVSPDRARSSRAWPPGVGRVAQGGGDLGQRMQRVFDMGGRGPVVIVGTDIPGISATHVAAAFRALRDNDAVIGPAGDGGYWLIGLRRRPNVPRIFDRVRWSSAHAFADTLANLAGRRVARLAELADVDEGADLARQAGHVGRRITVAGAPNVKPT